MDNAGVDAAQDHIRHTHGSDAFTMGFNRAVRCGLMHNERGQSD
jgi:hypothetical protein